MTKECMRGQRARVADLTSSSALTIGLHFAFPGAEVVDVSCFGVDANDTLSDERYFVFYNQKQSPEGAVRMLGSQGGDTEQFAVDLSRLPSFIRRLVFVATLDSAGTMAQLTRGQMRIIANSADALIYRFDGSDFGSEKALIVGEFYVKDGWRFKAVGQGFEGGLSALLQHFGGVETTEESLSPEPAPPTPQNTTPEPPSTPAPQQSGKPQCVRCGKTIGLFGSLGFNRQTKRCGNCEKKVKQALTRFRELFQDYCQDGILTQEEWQSLRQRVTQERMDWGEALAYVRSDALSFLERTLAMAFADGIITDEEERDFHWLRTNLEVPDSMTASLLERLEYLKRITAIAQGTLPVIQATVVLESDETCHLETVATYRRVRARTIDHVPGRLIATSKQLHFVSDAGGFTIKLKNIMRAEEDSPGSINLELSVKSGNGRYEVEDSMLAAAVISTLVRLDKRQLIKPQANGASRHIPHAVKIAVWQRDQGKCVKCGASEYLEFDHIIPFSKGGANTEGNVQLLCRRCNLEKGDRI